MIFEANFTFQLGDIIKMGQLVVGLDSNRQESPFFLIFSFFSYFSSNLSNSSDFIINLQDIYVQVHIYNSSQGLAQDAFLCQSQISNQLKKNNIRGWIYRAYIFSCQNILYSNLLLYFKVLYVLIILFKSLDFTLINTYILYIIYLYKGKRSIWFCFHRTCSYSPPPTDYLPSFTR